MRWPKGPPHLALNPPYLLFFFVFFWFVVVPFLSLLCNTKNCFPPRKGHFLFIFECLPLFLLSFFGAPPFSISLSLSLSFLLFCLSSFLSFFFAFFWFLVFVSFFLFLSSLLFFHQRNNIKIFNCKFFSYQYFLFLGFLSLFFFQVPFSYLVFCWFKVMFLFNIIVFGFKKNQVEKKKHQFLVKGGLQQNRFFYDPVFCKMWKVIVFWGHFLGKFWLMFKKHYANRYFSTF